MKQQKQQREVCRYKHEMLKLLNAIQGKNKTWTKMEVWNDIYVVKFNGKWNHAMVDIRVAHNFYSKANAKEMGWS